MGVRNRTEEAANHCRRAYFLLAVAVDNLNRPMRVADGDDGRARVMATNDLLVDAASNLAVAVSLMMDTEQVALRGAALNPAAPLRSFRDIGVANNAERNLRAALEKLSDTRVRADSAWVSVQKGRSRLWAAYQLLKLNHEGLPGVDGFLDNERVAARDDVRAALQLASDSVLAVGTAAGWWF